MGSWGTMLTDTSVAVLCFVKSSLRKAPFSWLPCTLHSPCLIQRVRVTHCNTHSWSELSIHICVDELAPFPGVGGAAADFLDAQCLELDPCPFAP